MLFRETTDGITIPIPNIKLILYSKCYCFFNLSHEFIFVVMHCIRICNLKYVGIYSNNVGKAYYIK